MGVGDGRGVIVEITDAEGRVFQLEPNASGNILLERAGAQNPRYQAPFATDFAYPYRARVIFEGRSRSMRSAQTSGDCNLCHTALGDHGATGRVHLP